MDTEFVVEETAATPVVSDSRPVPMSREGRDPAKHFGTVTGAAGETLMRIVAEAYR